MSEAIKDEYVVRLNHLEMVRVRTSIGVRVAQCRHRANTISTDPQLEKHIVELKRLQSKFDVSKGPF